MLRAVCGYFGADVKTETYFGSLLIKVNPANIPRGTSQDDVEVSGRTG